VERRRVSAPWPIQELGPEEVPCGRDFTAPSHDARDLRTLIDIREALRWLMDRQAEIDPKVRRFSYMTESPTGMELRHQINNPRGLWHTEAPFVVGFCGFVRDEGDRAEAERLDDRLIREFPSFDGLFSYSVLQAADGNFCNLIFFRDEEAMGHWAGAADHEEAAHVFAPTYYSVVRIHCLTLPGGLDGSGVLEIARTSYYDFRGEEPWKAVRLRGPRPASARG